MKTEISSLFPCRK